MFKFRVASNNTIAFKEFLKQVGEITKGNFHFLYRPARRCANNKGLIFKKENLLEFLEDVLANCHSLRDKEELYFLFSYLLFRFKKYPNENLSFILTLSPLDNTEELKVFISSNLNSKYKEIILKDFDYFCKNLKISQEYLLDLVQDHLTKTKTLIDLVEKICS